MRLFLRTPIAAVIACALAAALHAQADSAVYVVSYLEAVPANQGRVATMLEQLSAASRKEGALRYEVLQRTTQPSQFVILETWKDQQTIDAHVAAEHTRRFAEQTAPLLLSPMDRRLLVATTVGPARGGGGSIYVVTHIDVGPGGRAEAARLIEVFAQQTRNEPGNVRFDVAHERMRTNHFTVVEAWADQKAGESHQLAAHTRSFRAQLQPFLGALYDQRWYKPL